MKEEDVFSVLRQVGCCNGCCARFLGLRTPQSYARLDELAAKYTKSSTSKEQSATMTEVSSSDVTSSPDAEAAVSENGRAEPCLNGHGNGGGEPPNKRRRWEVCVCCLGVLQRETWPEAISQVVEALSKNGYESTKFACGLSSPACISLREKSLLYYLQEKLPEFTQQTPTPLKEAWKWCFGPALELSIGKTLDSGAVCPLLITIHVDYDKDAEELEVLRGMAPEYYAQRARNTRQFPLDTTRRCVQDVLDKATPDSMRSCYQVPPPHPVTSVHTLSVRCEHAPIYIAGRYIKLSRQLSQTPWLVDGKRMMESSVQDVIFEPIAKFFRIPAEDMERRLKLITSGREDVDVRCLGDGRPFAIEVSDPHLSPTADQLQELCQQISTSRAVTVKTMRLVEREALALLKKGEDSKAKTYRALCIKLPPDALQETKELSPTVVTDEDLNLIKTYTQGDESCRIKLHQKTPLRVLHRRPLLTRERHILSMDADRVPGHPNLFTLTLRTDAGTYVKEFVHGDLGRTQPCLRDILSASVDILALDVTAVDLPW